MRTSPEGNTPRAPRHTQMTDSLLLESEGSEGLATIKFQWFQWKCTAGFNRGGSGIYICHKKVVRVMKLDLESMQRS